MTTLTKPVSRETAKLIGKRPVIVTVAPCGAQSEGRIGLRLKGTRTQYTATVSDLYRGDGVMVWAKGSSGEACSAESWRAVETSEETIPAGE